MDDDFIKLVFDDDSEAMELLLNVLLDRYDMKVLSVDTQHEAKNPNGRSVQFDIYAVDSTGKHYDIEIQRSDSGAVKRRARSYNSMFDSRFQMRRR